MAQATSHITPDLASQEDTPMSPSEQQGTGEKKSMFGKLKEKTKNKTSKLKHKLKPGSGGNAGDNDTSSSSSEDEADTPTNNAFQGMTQPEYERKLNSGQLSPQVNDADSLFKSQSPSALATEEFNQRTPSDFPPSHGQESSLSKQFEGLSTDDKPSSERDEKFAESTGPDEGLGGKIDRDAVVEKDDILSKAGDPRADDTIVGHEKPDPEGLLSGAEKAAEPPKSWGQWVGEKVGLAKPSSSPTPTTPESSTDDKPLTVKLQESIIGAKDAVVGKTSEASEAAKSGAEETKEAAANTDPAKQTYTQKLTGAIYGAKDSLMSSTQPGDDEKALSQKVTETVSNLPTTIKSTLGFGKGQAGAASSPTTTSRTGTLDTPIPTEEAPGAPPTSPGLVSRITGSVTSLFGAKKQPSDSPTASSGHHDSATPTSGSLTSETTGTTGA